MGTTTKTPPHPSAEAILSKQRAADGSVTTQDPVKLSLQTCAARIINCLHTHRRSVARQRHATSAKTYTESKVPLKDRLWPFRGIDHGMLTQEFQANKLK